MNFLAKRREPWVPNICNAKLLNLSSFSYMAVLTKDGVTSIKQNTHFFFKKRFVGDNDSSIILC